MQKLMILAFVFSIAACRTEIATSTHQSEQHLLRSYIKHTLPGSTIRMLDWEGLSAISSRNTIVGYQIPIKGSTTHSYQFILVNFQNGVPGAIYKNKVTYTTEHNSPKPIEVENYNYTTRKTVVYNTRQVLFGHQDLATKPKPGTPMAIGLKVLGITYCGIYGGQNQKSPELVGMDAYLLAYLLGLEDNIVAVQNASQHYIKPAGIIYYNPISKLRADTSDPLLEWEVAR